MPTVFAEPGRLLLLVFAALLAVAVALGTRRRRREWRALGLAGDPPSAGVGPWWLAAVALILALAAPRWGRIAGSEVPPGHDVVFLVDVSRSMAAEDAMPDRLGLARGAAQSLVAQLRREPGDRSAVVAFAGRAVARCPLTENLDAVASSLDDLRPGMIDPGGTDLGAGLTAALAAFDREDHAEGRSIVVLSDGEDHAESWPPVVGRLVEADVVVHVVAIGDPDGDHPVPPPAGMPVAPPDSRPMTRRVDAALAQVAHATDGAVVPLGVAAGDLGALYRDRIAPTERGRRPEPRFAERAERFPVFLAVALLAGLVGTWPPPLRTWRRRGRMGRPGPDQVRLMITVLVALIVIVVTLAAGPPPGSPRARAEAATTRGTRAYRDGQFAAALAAFDEAVAIDPRNPIGHFDAGAALFALGRYPEAVARYGEARTWADRRLLVKVDYALGNATALAGDLSGAVGHYEASLASAEPGLDLDAVRRDAAINRAFILARTAPPLEAPRGGDDGEGEGERDADGKRPPRPDRRPSSPRPDAGSPAKGDDSAADAGPSGNRGDGGAGGGGAAPPEAGSPEGQLDAALRRIKAAKDKAPGDPPPPPAPGSRGAGKDW